MTDVKHMKWWGWGDEGVGFHWEDKPGFASFVQYAVGLDLHTAKPASPPKLGDLTIPKSVATAAIGQFSGRSNQKQDAHSRRRRAGYSRRPSG